MMMETTTNRGGKWQAVVLWYGTPSSRTYIEREKAIIELFNAAVEEALAIVVHVAGSTPEDTL